MKRLTIQADIRTEIPKEMYPTLSTLTIIKEFEGKGFHIFEVDDSPSSFQTVEQLAYIAGSVGYRLIKMGSTSVHDLTDRNHNMIGSGKYLLVTN